jgi:hypothetical protein
VDLFEEAPESKSVALWCHPSSVLEALVMKSVAGIVLSKRIKLII